MSALSDVYRGENDFDFPRSWKPLGLISLILIVGSLASLFTQGLNLSIDFEGGSVWEVPSDTLSPDQAEAVLADFGSGAGEKFQEATTADGVRVLRVSGRVDNLDESQKVAAALAEAADIPVTDVAVTTVGPSWGKDITRTARNSLVIFMVLVVAYIAWRLEPKMAISAVAAVFHDIILTVGFYSVFRIEVSPATVIAFLTILGFSLYDTIVVYDRLQENAVRLSRTGQYTYTAITRRSLNQVMMRSVNTTIVTLIPVLSMLVVGQYVFGEQTLGDFSLALLIGLASGAYSSLCVAAPLTAVLKEREPRYREIRERLVAKGLDPDDTRWHGVHVAGAPLPGSERPAAARSATTTGTSAPPLTTTIGGHPPRPRKKRR
ncbi:MAG: protein translocase subunit SecF [Microthrixaceae bacterium]